MALVLHGAQQAARLARQDLPTSLGIQWMKEKYTVTPRGEKSTDLKLLLTIDEAATALGLGRSALYELVGRGELHSVKIGRSRRVPVLAPQKFVARLIGEDMPQ